MERTSGIDRLGALWQQPEEDADALRNEPAPVRLNRGEFCFPARETRLSVESGLSGRERLVISGPSGGQAAVVCVTPSSRAVLEQIWKALTAAGATYGQ